MLQPTNYNECYGYTCTIKYFFLAMENVSDVGMEPDLTLDDNEAQSGMIKGYVFFFLILYVD